ncbi:MAG: alpha/beta hydrolase [Gammaproteobacteria bacterium]|jgi:pimeloyl-ACP methyl ester carboxylesterase|nr:alpha/beta hydrolase [Gammaproteobacteria bacterium]|tara:strand:+ start:910 stop:1671 length:762 start_codon:yes stop_codon:yes gene_type:complete
MSYLNRDDTKIYYEVHGAGDTTIILSHGYSATSAMWKGQVEAFSDNYQVITWDMRGHGLSDSPDDPTLYSEAHAVGDMAAILDECGVGQAVVGGLSLGGYMSLAFNLVHGARVAALMLFDTGPGYKKDAARDGWNEMAGERAKEFEEKGLDALGASNEVRVSSHRSAQGLAHAARGMLAQVDSRVIMSLPDIQIPTLVLVGAQDHTFITPTDYMTAKIPGAKKVVIPDAGHASNIDQPVLFNQAVEQFLSPTL